MKTDVVKPKGVFYNPTRLVVPLFQRPYVWSKEEQWEPLWQDIVRLIEVISQHDPQATHFLGAVVIQSVPTTLGSIPAWSVIDGQQRLTTLQLLLDALHSELERRTWPSLAEQIQPLVENPTAYRETDQDRYKLWPTNRDRTGFTSVMSAPTPVDYTKIVKSRLGDAHRFFAEQMAAWIGDDEDAERRARMLVATITDRLEIASISLDANEDAQAIFETLNARGTPLSSADLIKNFVFQRLGHGDAAAEAAYHTYWADFETPFWEAEVVSGRVKHSRSSLFLWQWLTARTLLDFPIREVFTQFKHYVNTSATDVAALLAQIKAAADKYRAVIEGAQRLHGPLGRVELFAYRVSTLDSEIARSILIWLDEPEQDAASGTDRDRFVAILESWFVRRALVKAPSQGANRYMVDLLQYLSQQPKDRLPEALESYLAGSHATVGYWPDDNEARKALEDAPVFWKYLRGRLRMILETIEDARRGFPDGPNLTLMPIVRGKATVEHLMPQNWRKHWPADLTEQQEKERNHLIQTIGNLTLVTQSLNSKLSNGPWSNKREHLLKHDDLFITRDAVRSGEEWDEAAIRSRSTEMVDQILALWPVPAGHVGLTGGKSTAAPTVIEVDVAQLVASGWLDAGANLRALPAAFTSVYAVVAQDGRLYVGNNPHDTPSGAARAVTGTQVNGWVFWELAGTARTLADVRSDYLQSLGEGSAEIVDEMPPELAELLLDVADADE